MEFGVARSATIYSNKFCSFLTIHSEMHHMSLIPFDVHYFIWDPTHSCDHISNVVFFARAHLSHSCECIHQHVIKSLKQFLLQECILDTYMDAKVEIWWNFLQEHISYTYMDATIVLRSNLWMFYKSMSFPLPCG